MDCLLYIIVTLFSCWPLTSSDLWPLDYWLLVMFNIQGWKFICWDAFKRKNTKYPTNATNARCNSPQIFSHIFHRDHWLSSASTNDTDLRWNAGFDLLTFNPWWGDKRRLVAIAAHTQRLGDAVCELPVSRRLHNTHKHHAHTLPDAGRRTHSQKHICTANDKLFKLLTEVYINTLNPPPPNLPD